jgi:hypothetical protein
MTASMPRTLLILGACLTGFALVGPRPLESAAAAGAVSAGGTSAAVSVGGVRVTVSSPTHRPKVNVPWPVRVTVVDAKGKPVAATLTMRVLFGAQPVGTIDDGAIYHFVGTWQERKGKEITWPPASRGEPLTLQFVVKAQGATVRKNWAINVS